MTSTPLPASVGLRLGSAAVDLGVTTAAACVGLVLSGSAGVAGVVAAETLVALGLARAATGRTPGALLTRTVAHAEGTDHAPGLRLRGTRVVDLRPAPDAPVHRDAYGRETATAPGWQGEEAPRPRVAVAPTPTVAASPRAAAPLLVPTPPSPPATVPGILLVADTGQRCPVRGTVVIGRAPAASTEAGETVFEIADDTRSLSRNHARVGVDASGAWIEDAASANGTAIRDAAGSLRTLAPGERVGLSVGDRVILGDRTLEVHPA